MDVCSVQIQDPGVLEEVTSRKPGGGGRGVALQGLSIASRYNARVTASGNQLFRYTEYLMQCALKRATSSCTIRRSYSGFRHRPEQSAFQQGRIGDCNALS
jgi:hypothetical protein